MNVLQEYSFICAILKQHLCSGRKHYDLVDIRPRAKGQIKSKIQCAYRLKEMRGVSKVIVQVNSNTIYSMFDISLVYLSDLGRNL